MRYVPNANEDKVTRRLANHSNSTNKDFIDTKDSFEIMIEKHDRRSKLIYDENKKKIYDYIKRRENSYLANSEIFSSSKHEKVLECIDLMDNMSIPSSNASKKRVSFQENIIETDVESGYSVVKPINNRRRNFF